MGRHQNLSVALLSQTQELPFYCFYLLELHKLIPLHDDIPSSSSSAVGKSVQSNQARFGLSGDHCPAGSGRENINKHVEFYFSIRFIFVRPILG